MRDRSADEGAPSKASNISILELKAALRLAREDNAGGDPAELIRTAARLLGFRRVRYRGEKIKRGDEAQAGGENQRAAVVAEASGVAIQSPSAVPSVCENSDGRPVERFALGVATVLPRRARRPVPHREATRSSRRTAACPPV